MADSQQHNTRDLARVCQEALVQPLCTPGTSLISGGRGHQPGAPLLGPVDAPGLPLPCGASTLGSPCPPAAPRRLWTHTPEPALARERLNREREAPLGARGCLSSKQSEGVGWKREGSGGREATAGLGWVGTERRRGDSTPNRSLRTLQSRRQPGSGWITSVLRSDVSNLPHY